MMSLKNCLVLRDLGLEVVPSNKMLRGYTDLLMSCKETLPLSNGDLCFIMLFFGEVFKACHEN